MHKSKAADLYRVPKNCPTIGHYVHTAWAINARPLVPECPLDGQDRHLMVSYRTAYVIFLIQLIPQFGIKLAKLELG